jgi:7-keto-8-aminopelargonate synthetase-like enzyme
MTAPIDQLLATLRQTGISRFVETFGALYPDLHLKDLTVEAAGPGRDVRIDGRRVVNFGSDSFLGLDRDPRVQEAVCRGVATWGTHNGASRAFASVEANVVAEEKLAAWLGTEATLIYPSVTLANMGAIPGLVAKPDFLVADEFAHNSIHEGVRLAKGTGVRAATFAHDDPADLERVLTEARPYRHSVVLVDGVYSMSGTLPPLADLAAVARRHGAVMYVDDAHGTGVLGPHGIGTVRDALGGYDNALVAGSLSKAFSAMGGYIGCSKAMQRQLKMRSNTYIFGGPVPPPYLEAVCTVVDILASDEYESLIGSLRRNQTRLTDGLKRQGLTVLGGCTPIVSVLVGEEGATLRAGKFLFAAGYYVQSVVFPAVPYHAGVIRIQVNSNHETAQIDGLLAAVAELQRATPLPLAG